MVDYLRTCYEAPFLVDENNTVPLRGRYYRAFDGAEVARSAFFYRSATWLDPWDREIGLGDQWPNSTYYDGKRPLDPPLLKSQQVLRANGNCSGQEVRRVVPGWNGLPLYCSPGPLPGVELDIGWFQAAYFRVSDSAITVWQFHRIGAVGEYVGDYRWEFDLNFGDPGFGLGDSRVRGFVVWKGSMPGASRFDFYNDFYSVVFEDNVWFPSGGGYFGMEGTLPTDPDWVVLMPFNFPVSVTIRLYM